MSYKTINDLISDSKIDFTNSLIGIDSSENFDIDDNFDISPEKYLVYAKKDFKSTDDRGLINSLSNSKRAIDCQIDVILKYLNLNLNYNNILNFCNHFVDDEQSLPFKLKVIKAYNLAPVITISNIRNLRNKVEHEYKIPNKTEVISAIELAELFVQSLKSKYEKMFSFEITDIKHQKNKQYISGILFDIFDNILTISYNRKRVSVDNENDFYPIIIAMMLSVYQDQDNFIEYLKYFVNLYNHKIPSGKVKIKRYE
ncbi:MAG: hypothetical protein KAW92_04060 [Candidatus Cloacimonetes bacterium]|nr:hypothetical protein [Candidatus Cloacimonadota bacterium]